MDACRSWLVTRKSIPPNEGWTSPPYEAAGKSARQMADKRWVIGGVVQEASQKLEVKRQKSGITGRWEVIRHFDTSTSSG
jgi:hypothetical protein